MTLRITALQHDKMTQNFGIIMLSSIMLSPIMLSPFMLSLVILSPIMLSYHLEYC